MQAPLQAADRQAVLLLVKAGALSPGLGADCAEAGTALMMAASAGHQAMLELLLSAPGEDIDSQGNTALHLAALHGHPAAVSALLKAGTGIGRENTRRNTPLELAARAGHVAAASVLLDSEQDPERAARNGQMALKHAAHKNHPAVVELLLQRGVTVDDEAMQLAHGTLISELLQRAGLLLQATRPDEVEEDAAPKIDGARLVATLVDSAARRKHARTWERRLKTHDICNGLLLALQAAASDLRAVWSALAGVSRKITPAQQKNWCAGILADLDNAVLRDPPYSGKGLTSATEAMFNRLAGAQAHALAQAGLEAEQALREGIDALPVACKKAVSEERFDPLELYRLLTAQRGIYDTVASLIVAAFADVWPRRSMLGNVTLEQAFARELSERRQKLKMIQAINSSGAEVENQQTVQMLTFRQLDLLAAWCARALGQPD
ncbi:MAG: ankyrin repeat domain-containing protein [Noviherbaspirillum sp.]